MRTEPAAIGNRPAHGVPDDDSAAAIPQTKDEKREYLRRLGEFRAYLKSKYGTFDDSVAVLAQTRERHDERP